MLKYLLYSLCDAMLYIIMNKMYFDLSIFVYNNICIFNVCFTIPIFVVVSNEFMYGGN